MCKFHFFIDFDDTLTVCPRATINAIEKQTNNKIAFSTQEWTLHTIDQNKYDYDWSQFSRLALNYEPINETLRLVNDIYKAYGTKAISILTSRRSPVGPQEFLKIFGMNDMRVVALGEKANCHDGKANYIRQQIIDNELSYVSFFDDNIYYVNEVKKLQQEFPDVIFNVQHVTS
jgi:hypothetical protein